VMLRVTARAENANEAEKLLSPAVSAIIDEVGEYLYGVDVGDLQTAAVQVLSRRGLTVAAAEDCTGGYIAKRLTDVEGCETVFRIGFVVFSDEAKQELLGISPETLEKYGTVSPEAAMEMAKAVRKVSGADIGTASVGHTGPGPNGKSGEVYIAVDSDWHSEAVPLNFFRHDQDAREYIRWLASSKALHMIWQAAMLNN